MTTYLLYIPVAPVVKRTRISLTRRRTWFVLERNVVQWDVALVTRATHSLKDYLWAKYVQNKNQSGKLSDNIKPKRKTKLACERRCISCRHLVALEITMTARKMSVFSGYGFLDTHCSLLGKNFDLDTVWQVLVSTHHLENLFFATSTSWPGFHPVKR